jgi:hypothetical protein
MEVTQTGSPNVQIDWLIHSWLLNDAFTTAWVIYGYFENGEPERM